jgi:hypothetical protein
MPSNGKIAPTNSDRDPTGRQSLPVSRFGEWAVPVVRRDARYPSNGAWPLELRASSLAALLDYENTRQLCKAVARNEAPKPTAIRRDDKGQSEPIWSLEAVREFVNKRHGSRAEDEGQSTSLLDDLRRKTK